jgi:hypothetical protein
MKPIATANHLAEARSQDYALVFLWVVWASQARHSEAAVRKLLEWWQASHPERPISVYRADLSSQQGEAWTSIREWLSEAARPVDELMFGGNGASLWSRFGSIVAHEPNSGILADDRLQTITCHAFEPFGR